MNEIILNIIFGPEPAIKVLPEMYIEVEQNKTSAFVHYLSYLCGMCVTVRRSVGL